MQKLLVMQSSLLSFTFLFLKNLSGIFFKSEIVKTDKGILCLFIGKCYLIDIDIIALWVEICLYQIPFIRFYLATFQLVRYSLVLTHAYLIHPSCFFIRTYQLFTFPSTHISLILIMFCNDASAHLQMALSAWLICVSHQSIS